MRLKRYIGVNTMTNLDKLLDELLKNNELESCLVAVKRKDEDGMDVTAKGDGVQMLGMISAIVEGLADVCNISTRQVLDDLAQALGLDYNDDEITVEAEKIIQEAMKNNEQGN